MSLPAFSGLFASFIAAAAAAPDDIPICKKEAGNHVKKRKILRDLNQHTIPSNGVIKMPTVWGPDLRIP